MRGRVGHFWWAVQWQVAEARHERVVWVIVAAAVLLVGSGSVLRVFNFGEAEPQFFTHVARVALWVGGGMIGAMLGPALIHGGIRSGLAAALFARGMSRWTWLAATLAALWITLAWLTLLLAGGLAVVLQLHGHAGGGQAGLILLRDLGGLLIFAGAAVMFSVVFRQAVPASLAAVALLFAGAFAPIVDRMAAKSLGAERIWWVLLDWLVPNLALQGGQSGWAATAYVLGYGVLYLGVGGMFFSRREL